MDKKCGSCGELKPLEEFCRKGILKNGKVKRNAYCRLCNSVRCKEYYHNNKEHHLKVIKKNKIKYRKNRKEFIQNVKQINGCALCEEKELCCLDFHHLYNKDFLLSTVNITSIEKIKKELKKCVCLCSNCHRKVHNNLLSVDESHICEIPEKVLPNTN